MSDHRDSDYQDQLERQRWWNYDSKGNWTSTMEKDFREFEFPIWISYQKMRCRPQEEITWTNFIEEWVKTEGYKQYDFENEDYV